MLNTQLSSPRVSLKPLLNSRAQKDLSHNDVKSMFACNTSAVRMYVCMYVCIYVYVIKFRKSYVFKIAD